ncbi:hypothetical protein NLG97_g1677 [Lecanicillium saksenae]|uniref:Uncharacterized protein n=1 Tax=Lecanicillium saksenae TaxID=468837 RepID=A0ACC1R6D2_9HYPO|nr:hypothetical protein NLG97_g1677 [Lecanicillium saksenae]
MPHNSYAFATRTMPPLLSLPHEILSAIVLHLGPSQEDFDEFDHDYAPDASLSCLAQTCRTLYDLATPLRYEICNLKMSSRLEGLVLLRTLAAMEKRSKQLASFLNETVADLKALSASNLDDKVKSLQMIEVAAAKVQFVQIYLEDSTMDVPLFQAGQTSGEEGKAEEISKEREAKPVAKTAVEGKPKKTQSSEKAISDVPPAVPEKPAATEKKAPAPTAQHLKLPGPAATKSSTSKPTGIPQETLSKPSPEANKDAGEQPMEPTPSTPGAPAPTTPTKPVTAVPTRSTIAQSSFSWMLEPDESTPSASATAASKSPPLQSKKRSSNNMSRERNAFLFGDGGEDIDGSDPLSSSGIFGLESMSKKGK